jgi:CHASE3 domain sensor protein
MSSPRRIKLLRAHWRRPSPGAARTAQEATFSLVQRVFWVAGLALLAVAVTIGVLEIARARTQSWARDSREVTRLARHGQALAIDRQTSIQKYLLTGDRTVLGSEVALRAQLMAKLDSLAASPANNPVQRRRALIARDAVDRWERDFALPAMALADRRAALEALESARVPGAPFDDVRSAFARLIDAEEVLYARRMNREDMLRRVGIRVVLLEILALIVVLLMLRIELIG